MANFDYYKSMSTRQDLEPWASGASRLCQQSDLVSPMMMSAVKALARHWVMTLHSRAVRDILKQFLWWSCFRER